MASISEILLAQGRHAAESRRSRAGQWQPLIQSLANLPGAIMQDRRAEQAAQAEAQEAAFDRQQQRDVRGQQLAAGTRTEAAAQATADQKRQMNEILASEGVFGPDQMFNASRAQEIARAKGYTEIVDDILSFGQENNDAVAKRAREQASGERDQATFDNQQTDRRQTANQQGVRRMIGESVAARGGAPIGAADRQTLQGMAFQEGVSGADMDRLLPEEKPDTRSLQQQANDALRGGDTQGYSRIMRVIRETAAAGRAPQQAEDPLARRERELRIKVLEQSIQKAAAAPAASNERLEAVAPVLDEIVDLSGRIFTSDAGPITNIVGAWKAGGAAANMNNDVREYRSLVRGFTPLMARAVGHNGVLTEQDVERTEMLFPQIGILGTDNTTVANNKLDRMKRIMVGGGTEAEKAEIRRLMGWSGSGAGTAPPRWRGAGPAGAQPIVVDGFEVIPN